MRTLLACATLVLSLAAATATAEPLHFTKLIEFLPPDGAFAGFERQKPEGTTTNAMGFHTSVVSATWVGQDDGAKRIEIQYTDGAPTQMVTTAYAALSQFSKESTEGYEKGVKLGDFQAIETFKTAGQNGSLSVVVGEVVVHIETAGVPAEMMRAAWEKVPAQEILAAKP